VSGGGAPRYPIDSVDNALRLVALVAERESVSVADAATELGVARSTAHRLLAMLQHHGFAEQDAVRRVYVPGPALTRLGLAALRDLDVRASARHVLERIVDEVGETAHLVMRRGAAAVFVDCVESRRAVRAGSRTGDALPAHCTAGGKALLAELDPGTLERLYPEEDLPGLTAASIATRTVLWAELAGVRERGYATNEQESEDDLHAVARAVRDPVGRIIGSITVSGPRLRLPPDGFPALAAAIERHWTGGQSS
jgi:DNA-binding IclR family transcriptional regulator